MSALGSKQTFAANTINDRYAEIVLKKFVDLAVVG